MKFIKKVSNKADAIRDKMPGEARILYVDVADRILMLPEDRQSDDVKLLLAQTYDKLCDIDGKWGNSKASQEWHRKSVDIYGKISDELKSELKTNVAIAENASKKTDAANPKESSEVTKIRYQNYPTLCYIIGLRLESGGNLHDAEEYYIKALEATDRSQDEVEDMTELMRRRAYYCDKLGDFKRKHFNSETDAKLYYEKALKIRKELVDKLGMMDVKRDLLQSYRRMESCAVADSNELLRRDCEINRLGLAEEAVEKVSDNDDRVIGFEVGKVKGRTYELKGDYRPALDQYSEAAKFGKKLADATGSVDIRRSLAAVYNSICEIFVTQKTLPNAYAYSSDALKIMRQLVDEDGSQKSISDMIVQCGRMAKIAYSMGKRDEFDVWKYMKEEILKKR